MPILIAGSDKRSQIFEAAVSIFSQKGYHGATVDDLASAAGVAKGTIYNYFKNKADIFTQLYTEVESRIWQGLEAVKAEVADPFERIRRCFGYWCEAFHAFGQECPLMLEMWSTACCHPGEHEEVRQCLARTYERTFADMQESLQAATEAGCFPRDLDLTIASRAMCALFDGLLLQALIEGNLDNLLAHGPTALDLLLKGFRSP